MKANGNIAIIGLGPVGLTLAIAFAQHFNVLGFDHNTARIDELTNQYDRFGLFSPEVLTNTTIQFTDKAQKLTNREVFIICVTTPLTRVNEPDLSALLSATETVAKYISKNSTVIYESTVFPGATQERCIPILEKHSGLKVMLDFGVGYSPERINPGDPQHSLSNTPKVISATDKNTLLKVKHLYHKIIAAELIPVSQIKAAEAVKVIENTQRDVLIAFFNEMAMTLHHFGIDANEVFHAAASKWNFISLKPGLVGGDCIATDPYYLIYQATKIGFYPQLAVVARHINDSMPKFIIESCIKQLLQLGKKIKDAKVALLGVTFKENYPDINNSKIVNMIKELQSYYINVCVHDPIVDPKLLKERLDVVITDLDAIKNMDAIIVIQSHLQYQNLSPKELKQHLSENGLLVDVKGIYDANKLQSHGINYWRL